MDASLQTFPSHDCCSDSAGGDEAAISPFPSSHLLCMCSENSLDGDRRSLLQRSSAPIRRDPAPREAVEHTAGEDRDAGLRDGGRGLPHCHVAVFPRHLLSCSQQVSISLGPGLVEETNHQLDPFYWKHGSVYII